MNELGRALFAPCAIALIGASSDPSRLTARAQRYLRQHGFAGTVYLVNPRGGEVQGVPAFTHLADVPGHVDLAYILVGTEQAEAAIEDCALARIPIACVLADGFADAGPDGAARQARLLDAARAGGVRLLGPNSMGVVSTRSGMACSVNATLEIESLKAGRLALISQSGSMMGALLSRAAARGIGFSRFVSTGNEADLSAGELAGLLVDDDQTDAILLFLETIRSPDALAGAARRAHALGKPVLVYKLGRSDAGAALATTHTGALAGSDAAADAFFRAHGIGRVDMLETLFEAPALLLGGRPAPNAKRAAHVVTTTGGGGAMVVDRLGLLGIAASMNDVTLAGTKTDIVASALGVARDDPDAAIAIAVIGSSAQFHPQSAVAGVIAATGKNPVCAFLTPDAPESLRVLADAGIASFRTAESCAEAVRAWLDSSPPRAAVGAGDVSVARALVASATNDEPSARAVFAALGIADHARLIDPDAPPPLAYPVALKAVVPGLAHKTEAGAVALGLHDAAEVASAAAAMRTRLGAAITGFLVQPMARGLGEALIGFRRDPLVGPVVALGVGGVLSELFADVVVRLAPVSMAEASAMVADVRGLAPLRGYRGLPRGDTVALASAVVAVSRLAAIVEVAEAEINPLIVMGVGEGVVMADALLVGS